MIHNKKKGGGVGEAGVYSRLGYTSKINMYMLMLKDGQDLNIVVPVSYKNV